MTNLLKYRGNHTDVVGRTFYVTRSGSHAYGTNIATSDVDIRGIFIAPKKYYLGFVNKIEVVDAGFETDTAIYELRKFFALAADCNPNIIEILNTAPEDKLLITPVAEKLMEAAPLFLSTKARHSFSGYAVSQLKRINGHYKWLKLVAEGREPRMPSRAEYGLAEAPEIPVNNREAAEAAVRKQIEAWNVDIEFLDDAAKVSFKNELKRILTEMKLGDDAEVWKAAARTIGIESNMMDILEKERRYAGAVREYKQYCEWKKERNAARSELEAKFGYDTKHAMHLVRLLRMCKEILTTGKVLVKRPDAEELLAIRSGTWTYEQLVEYAEKMDAEMDGLYKTSPLPRAPDRNKLDNLCVELVEAYNGAL